MLIKPMRAFVEFLSKQEYLNENHIYEEKEGLLIFDICEFMDKYHAMQRNKREKLLAPAQYKKLIQVTFARLTELCTTKTEVSERIANWFNKIGIENDHKYHTIENMLKSVLAFDKKNLPSAEESQEYNGGIFEFFWAMLPDELLGACAPLSILEPVLGLESTVPFNTRLSLLTVERIARISHEDNPIFLTMIRQNYARDFKELYDRLSEEQRYELLIAALPHFSSDARYRWKTSSLLLAAMNHFFDAETMQHILNSLGSHRIRTLAEALNHTCLKNELLAKEMFSMIRRYEQNENDTNIMISLLPHLSNTALQQAQIECTSDYFQHNDFENITSIFIQLQNAFLDIEAYLKGRTKEGKGFDTDYFARKDNYNGLLSIVFNPEITSFDSMKKELDKYIQGAHAQFGKSGKLKVFRSEKYYKHCRKLLKVLSTLSSSFEQGNDNGLCFDDVRTSLRATGIEEAVGVNEVKECFRNLLDYLLRPQTKVDAASYLAPYGGKIIYKCSGQKKKYFDRINNFINLIDSFVKGYSEVKLHIESTNPSFEAKNYKFKKGSQHYFDLQKRFLEAFTGNQDKLASIESRILLLNEIKNIIFDEYLNSSGSKYTRFKPRSNCAWICRAHFELAIKSAQATSLNIDSGTDEAIESSENQDTILGETLTEKVKLSGSTSDEAAGLMGGSYSYTSYSS